LKRLYNLCRKLHWYLINIGHSHEQNHMISRCKAYYDRDLGVWNYVKTLWITKYLTIKSWGITYDRMESDTTDIASNMYHGTTLYHPTHR